MIQFKVTVFVRDIDAHFEQRLSQIFNVDNGVMLSACRLLIPGFPKGIKAEDRLIHPGGVYAEYVYEEELPIHRSHYDYNCFDAYDEAWSKLYKEWKTKWYGFGYAEDKGY